MLRIFFILCLFNFSNVIFADAHFFSDENVNKALQAYDCNQTIDEIPELRTYLEKYKSLVIGTHIPRKQKIENDFLKVKEMFVEHNLPHYLSYITFAESNFTPKAKGYGTAGLWQFTKSSAKILGLRVTKKNDERLHIRKSTLAAIKYLKQLKSKYTLLYLSDFAYGLGEKRLEKILRDSKDNTISSIWKHKSFTHGTKAHFAKLILMYCVFDIHENEDNTNTLYEDNNSSSEDMVPLSP